MVISVSNGDLPLAMSKPSTGAHEEYRPDIDGLRAIAALAVLGVHTGVLPGGFVGVDIFFVISGYLISRLIFRDLARGTFSSFEFYARRVKRIFPALIALLIVAPVLGWLTLLNHEYRQLGREITVGAVFIHNFIDRFHDDFHTIFSRRIALPHLWSLGVEEQFYLLWPLFLMSLWKLKRRQLAIIAGATVMSFIINVVMVGRGTDAAYFLPWTRLWQLSLGGAFAYMQSCRVAHLERLLAIFSTGPLSWFGIHSHHVRGLIGVALIVGSCIWFKDWSIFPGWEALIPSTGSALVIASGGGWTNRYVLGASPMVAIGLISYPLYLWHLLFLQIPHLISSDVTPIMTLVAVVVTFIFSFITYKYIELPIRHSPHTTVVACALCVAMLTCGAVGYVMSVGGLPVKAEPLDTKKFLLAGTEDWLPGTQSTSWTRGSDKFITLGSRSHYTLYIGDSNMQQYFPRIEKVLAEHPRNSRGAVFAARDWCAPVESDIPDSYGATSAVCWAFVRSAFEYAKGSKIDTVVISACWRCYFLSFEDPLLRSGKLNIGAKQALSTLRKEIERLVLAGKRVFLILGIPFGADLDPHSIVQHSIMPPGFRVVISLAKRSELAALIKPLSSRLIEIAQMTGARVIDPMPSLCDETMCSPVSPKGEPVYHDWFDLSPSYVRENVIFLDGTILDADAVGVTTQ